MLAEDLKQVELFKNTLNSSFFGSIRMFMVSVQTMAPLLRGLRTAYGNENYKNILLLSGYEAGIIAALFITNFYKFDSKAETLKACNVVGNILGWAHHDTENMEFNIGPESFHINGSWKDSFEVGCWKELYDYKSSEPVCQIISAVLSGCYSAVLGREILVQETHCQAQGHEHCVFEARTLQDWGLEVTSIKQLFTLENLTDKLARLQDDLMQAHAKLEAQEAEIHQLKVAPPKSDSSMVFRSQPMSRLLTLAQKIAPMKTTVLIQGESGTGKEVLARGIHRHSENSQNPFMALNCAALPPNLLESELFGHVKGAFTSADRDKRGLFLEAEGGTIFLDEVGELPMEIQAKLLRVLQEREIRPVGGLKNIPIKVRIIAATNRDLKNMTEEGSFRKDLYFRLSVFPLIIPPLRERREDILLLAQYFLKRISEKHPGFSPQAIRHMEAYSWPGNVRELENWIEYAVILSGDSRILPEHFPQIEEQPAGEDLMDLTSDLPSCEELQKRYITRVLEHTGNNKTEAARILQIGKSTLWRYLK